MSQDEPPKTKTGIKRKQTDTIAERLMSFTKKYPNGCIRTEQVAMLGRPFYRATVTPDIANPARFFTGHAPALSERGIIFRKATLLDKAEEAAVAKALYLIVSDEKSSDGQNLYQKTKPSVCQECGRVWKRTDDQNSGIFGICPECRIKKRLFSRLRVL